jgi:hypothetical protein
MGTASAVLVVTEEVVEVAGLKVEALASPSDRAFDGSSSTLTAGAVPATERRVSGVYVGSSGDGDRGTE